MPSWCSRRRLRAQNYWTAQRGPRAGARLSSTVAAARPAEGARTWATVWGAPQRFVGPAKREESGRQPRSAPGVERRNAGAKAARAGGLE